MYPNLVVLAEKAWSQQDQWTKNLSIKVNEKNKIKRELVSLLPINAIDSKMFFYFVI